MATIQFDKMRAARRLEGEGNFTRAQAETRSEVMRDSLSQGIATKADLDGLGAGLKATETALRGDFGMLRADLKAVEAALRSGLKAVDSALRADMSVLRADLNAKTATLEVKIAESKVQIIVWVVGLVTASFVASGVVQHFLH